MRSIFNKFINVMLILLLVILILILILGGWIYIINKNKEKETISEYKPQEEISDEQLRQYC